MVKVPVEAKYTPPPEEELVLDTVFPDIFPPFMVKVLLLE
jgi:hypothetical protein